MTGVSLLLLVVLSAAAAASPQMQLAGAASGDNSLRIIQKDIIETVNNHPNAGWTAGHNPSLANYTIEQFKHILGAKPTPPGLRAGVPTKTYSKSKELPKEFDARYKWSGCSTIGNILDQGHCGACWAFGTVECLQDRFCIHHSINISLSVNDLVACCGFLCGDGCDGGYPISAWQYFAENGVVTDECDPYFDQVGCKHPGCEPNYPTPTCEKKCKVQNQVWQEKKHFSFDGYFVNSDPHDIMAEVYENGPVEVAFTVYEGCSLSIGEVLLNKFAEQTVNYCTAASNNSLHDSVASSLYLVNEKEEQILQMENKLDYVCSQLSDYKKKKICHIAHGKRLKDEKCISRK